MLAFLTFKAQVVIEPNEFDHAQDGWLGIANGELPRFRSRSLGGADDNADARAVDERQL